MPPGRAPSIVPPPSPQRQPRSPWPAPRGPSAKPAVGWGRAYDLVSWPTGTSGELQPGEAKDEACRKTAGPPPALSDPAAAVDLNEHIPPHADPPTRGWRPAGQPTPPARA